jgi:hypothetical protein
MSTTPEHTCSSPPPPTPSAVPTTEQVPETIELGTEATPTATLQPGTPELSGQSSDEEDEDDEDNGRALDTNQAPKLEYLEKCVVQDLQQYANYYLTGYSHEIRFRDGILLLHFKNTLGETCIEKWTLDDDKDLGPVPASLSLRRFSVDWSAGRAERLREICKKRPREEESGDEVEVDIVGGVDDLPPMTPVTIEAEPPLKRARSSDE